jgi:hypothetical protein
MVLLTVSDDGTMLNGRDCSSMDECNDYFNAAWDFYQGEYFWHSTTNFLSGTNDDGDCRAYKRWRELYFLNDGTLLQVSYEYETEGTPDEETFSGCSSAPAGEYVCTGRYFREYQKTGNR